MYGRLLATKDSTETPTSIGSWHRSLQVSQKWIVALLLRRHGYRLRQVQLSTFNTPHSAPTPFQHQHRLQHHPVSNNHPTSIFNTSNTAIPMSMPTPSPQQHLNFQNYILVENGTNSTCLRWLKYDALEVEAMVGG